MFVVGKVKSFNNAKGFGFISFQSKDFFVHFTEINGNGYKSLREGDTVTFVPQMREKGRVAINVSLEAPETV